MYTLIISFVAGILSSLAPCVLPLLPVIVGGSLSADAQDSRRSRLKPLLITGSLFVSLIVFTLLLKASTVLLSVPQSALQLISGGIIVIFGLFTLFPHLYERLALRLNLGGNEIMRRGYSKKSWIGDILIGASLGPIFTSCSPVYAVVVATILPKDFMAGLVNIIVYALGLSLTLLCFARFGQTLVRRSAWASNPSGWFRRGLGIVLVIVGLLIVTGGEVRVQKYFLNHGYFDTTKIEERLVR